MNKIQNNIFHRAVLILIITTVSFVLLVIVLGRGQNTKVTHPESIFSKDIISLDNRTLSVLVADTDLSRAQGLAGVSSLNDNQGMLFEFDNVGSQGIWMKNMLIPIDILWLDSNGHVLTMLEKIKPETYPKIFKPKDIRAHYVLELASGYVERNNVKIGDLMTF